MELEKCKTFSENTTKMFMKQIFEALNFMHEKQVAHLDVKLSNIVIDNNRKIKLIDFEYACHESDLERRNSKNYYFLNNIQKLILQLKGVHLIITLQKLQ